MEVLKSLGLTEEQNQAITKEIQEKYSLKEEIHKSFIPKDQYNKVKAEKDALTAEIEKNKAEADKSKGTDEVIKSMQEKIASMENEAKNSVLRGKVLSEIEKAKPNSLDDIQKFLDFSKITLEDGNLTGLKEQMKELAASKSYLFSKDVSVDGRKPADATKTNVTTEKEEMEKWRAEAGL